MGLLRRLLQTPVDAVLLGGGRFLSAVQVAAGVEPAGRALTGAELSLLHQVFGASVDYLRVRIKEGTSGLLTLAGRPFVHGDHVYVPRGWLPLSEGTLTHELVHVWQFQHGGADYMREALVAQFVGDGYDWQKGIAEGKAWAQLNPEQQAALVEAAYRAGFFEGPGRRFSVDGSDYTAYLSQALVELRAGRGAP
jgi:hypothetical protein